MTMNPLAADLNHVLAHTEGLWEELRGNRIFITGGDSGNWRFGGCRPHHERIRFCRGLSGIDQGHAGLHGGENPRIRAESVTTF
jgi:hypothetical protein